MSRNQKQITIGIYKDTEGLLNEVVDLSGTLQSSVLRTAIKLGLQQMLAMHRAQQQQVQRLETLSGEWSLDYQAD